jgi:anti-sigma factor RsiW
VSQNSHNRHLDADLMQAFLDGELTAQAEATAREHLSSCARCRSEMEAWKLLMDQLAELDELNPSTTFADQVMARLELAPEPSPLEILETAPAPVHLAARELQDFVEGVLPLAAAGRVEEHLAGCSACNEEYQAWSELFAGLESLPVFAPSEAFADQVMARVEFEPSPGWLTRLQGMFGGGRRAVAEVSSHLSPDRLQDLVEGVLPAPQLARVESHLAACGECRAEAEAWTALMEGLGSLPELAPAEGFADRVMARVQVAPVAVAEPGVLARVPDLVRRLVPATRRGWAAVSVAAMAPTAVLAAALGYLFTRPQVTPLGLLQFSWWKLNELASAGFTSLAEAARVAASGAGVMDLASGALAYPGLVAGLGLAFSVTTVMALWVVYRNVLMNPVSYRNYAHVSA